MGKKGRRRMKHFLIRSGLLLAAGLLLLAGGALAQDDTAEPAKKAQNPVASMISLPFQNNINFGRARTTGPRTS